MKVLDTTGQVLRINAPEWFQLPAFRALLERGTQPQQKQRLATFHRNGDAANAWSDVFVPFEAYPLRVNSDGREIWDAEGSDISGVEDLDQVWQAIVAAAQEHRISHGVIWISNLALDS
jgi:hypothetical protein